MPSNGNDTFQAVLSDLDATAKNASTLLPPIGDLRTAVDDAATLVRDIQNLFTEYSHAVDAVRDLQQLCEGLDAIPGVDAIAGPAGTLLGEVYDAASSVRDSVVKPLSTDIDSVAGALTRVDGGIAKLQSVVSDIATVLPDVTNTVAILNVLTEIAAPLTQVLQGVAAADRLAALIKDYDAIRDEVSGFLKPVADAMNAISSAAAGAVSQLQKLASVRSVVNDVQQALGTVSGLLSPVSSAMHAVEDAIAPVKWALDAASCVVKSVFDPVINGVLDATGLSGLVDELKNKLANAIGVTSVTDALKNNLGATAIANAADALAPDALSSHWSSLGTSLGKYSTNKNAATKQAFSDLISAIAGTAVDPSKPAVIPDWPDVPTVSVPSAQLPTPPKSPARKAAVAPKPAFLRAAISARAIVPHTSASAPTGIAGVDQLNSAVSDAVKQLTALPPKATALSTALDGVQTSLKVPSSFGVQAQAVQTILGTGAEALDFLAGLGVFQQTLAPVASVLHDQAGHAGSLTTELASLQSAVAAIEAALKPVLDHVPAQQVIATAIDRLQGWAAGAGSLVAALHAGDTSSPKPPEQAQLASQRTLVDSRAAAVVPAVKQITSAAQQTGSSLDALTTALQGYASALQAVTQHDQMIADTALPNLAHITHILTAVGAIFDPLQQLLVDLGCSDASNSMKSGANTTRQAVVAAMQNAASPGLSFVVQLLLGFENKLIPLPALLGDVQRATGLLTSTTLSSVNSAGSDLINQLDLLTKALTASASYSVTFTGTGGKPVTQTVSNMFVTAPDATAAIALTNAIAGR